MATAYQKSKHEVHFFFFLWRHAALPTDRLQFDSHRNGSMPEHPLLSNGLPIHQPDRMVFLQLLSTG